MNIVLQTSERTLLSVSAQELVGLINALNEVCNGVHIPDSEVGSRLGVDRAFLASLHQELLAQPSEPAAEFQRVDVWAEPASVMLRAISVYGDPVEMSTSEAEALVGQLQQSIEAAS